MRIDTPSTVHPNLWRMEKLNNYNGIYQAYPAPEEGSDNKNERKSLRGLGVFANPVPQRGKRMLMTIFWIGAIIIKPH